MIGKRSVGFLLGLIVVIAVGTLVADFNFDSLISRERASTLSVDRELASIGRSIAEVRVAQGGYVATGQAPATWMTRATEALEQVKRALALRKASAPTQEAVAKYDAAIQAIANLEAYDVRARTSIAQDDRLHAADLIYIDAHQASEAALSEITAARGFEEQATAQRVRQWTMARMAMNGMALILIAVIALYFGRSLSILREAPPTTMAQMLRELPPPVKAQPAGVAAQPAPAPTAPIAATPSGRQVSLSAAAELCVDLARILDGRDVPALLERAAALIDAKGIMIWSVDTGGALLRPSMCFGYPERVMTRLRPLQVDGDNITSLAFRSMQPQSLPGAASTDAAALAIPLITSTGCVGVLAAEVRQSRPHPDLLPIARIVAAQFSTLVAPVDATPAAAAQN